jgi:hypothetical protein
MRSNNRETALAEPSSTVQQKPDLRALLSPDDVAAILGVPVASLYRWHSATSPGHPIGPKAFRVGHHLRYAADDLTAYINRLRSSAS